MVTVCSLWPRWSRLWGPMITAQSRLAEVTAQSRGGHTSVTARSLNHGIFNMITARSQLNHGSVTAGCDHFGHRKLRVSSPWAQGEQSRWPFFFLMGRALLSQQLLISHQYNYCPTAVRFCRCNFGPDIFKFILGRQSSSMSYVMS